MKLRLERYDFQDKATIGKLYIDGIFFCYTLEDVDRQLEDGGTKIQDVTAIPRGIYPVVIDMSNRFKRLMPHILNVTQFDGIRIHSGNTDENTEGCILLGQNPQEDWISNSRETFAKFYTELKAVIDKKESVTITIQ